MFNPRLPRAMRATLCLLTVSFSLASAACAATGAPADDGSPETTAAQPVEVPAGHVTAAPRSEALAKAQAEMQTRYEQRRTQYAEDASKFVRPGVLADRQARRITIDGAAIVLSPDDPVEFFLIGVDGGKSHEALALSFASPEHVNEALKFIGMKPGRPVDYAKQIFWPKGERVIMQFSWAEPPAQADGQPVARTVRVEQLVRDARTTEPLPDTGLVYVGSYTIKAGQQSMLAAQVSDAKSIASTYNEPTTILDVPRQAEQGEVYGVYIGNPAYRFTQHQPISITIEPEPRKAPRVLDLTLRIAPAADQPQGMDTLQFTLTQPGASTKPSEPNASASQPAAPASDAQTQPQQTPASASAPATTTPAAARSLHGGSFHDLLVVLRTMIGEGHDPYITLQFAPGLEVRAAHHAVQLLASLEGPRGIRLEPPTGQDLFFQAFLPPDDWRDRERRIVEPWELHITRDEGELDLELIDVQRDFQRDRLIERNYDVETPKAAARILEKEKRHGGRPVFVHPPHDLTYGRLLEILAPLRQTHDVIYIFIPRQAPVDNE